MNGNKNRWIGKAVSIQCVEKLGIFQGTIKEVSASTIVILRAFRNGFPMKPDNEILINATDIISLEVIPVCNDILIIDNNKKATSFTDSTKPINNKITTQSTKNDYESGLSNRIKIMNLSKNSTAVPNMKTTSTITSNSNQKVLITGNDKNNNNSNNSEQLLRTKSQSENIRLASSAPTSSFYVYNNNLDRNVSIPIDINEKHNQHSNNTNGGGTVSIRNEKKKLLRRHAYNNNQAFATSSEDPMLDEDFDFEKNLALFDKQAIWEEIDSAHKPDLVSQTPTRKNYRHDENILESKAIPSRQIIIEQISDEYATDDGLIIPSIPLLLRHRIQNEAQENGLIWERQCDMLGRGTTEICISLLGGARRLTPKNEHQWPKIIIICDRPYNDRQSEIGIVTGRLLASHGLKIYVVCKPPTILQTNNCKELELYKATGNIVANSINDLPSADLVILSVSGYTLREDITKWIIENRSPVIAIDPPVVGIKNIPLKCSILPILPLDGMSKTCGKLYLCNLGIPDQYFRNTGIKYKSPFGHKFVIPLHLSNDV